MKKYFAVLMLFFVSVGFVFAQPKLEIVGGNTYDFGKSNPKNSPLKVTIKIKNAGTELLKIKEVKPGCGCTNAPIKKNDLAPGEITDLDVTLNISTYTGDITKSIRITSNDPKNADTYLYLKAFVYRPVVVEPSQYLGKSIIYVNEPTVFNYQLANKTDKPVTITGVKTSPDDATLDIKQGDVIPPNSEKKYTIQYIAKQKGRLNGSLVISTNQPDTKEVQIYFYGNIIPRDEQKQPK